MERQPNTQYCLSISYGKDSLACLGAIEKLGLPLDRVIHAEVWATQDIPADLPPMVEFKAKADKIIKERWGIDVEHVCATKVDRVVGEKVDYETYFYQEMVGGKYVGSIKGFPNTIGSWCKKLKDCAIQNAQKLTYEDIFYKEYERGKNIGNIYGFPMRGGGWCTGTLKQGAINNADKFSHSTEQGAKINTVQYLGIAEDEPIRLERLDGITKVSPLHLIGWTESDCMQWCIENDLRSPLYDMSNRGGCWFCHNQGVEQLRLLRKNYPDLWELLLKWDSDSPTTFKSDGHTVHDYDRRFEAEDEGNIRLDEPFHWEDLNNLQIRWF